MSRYEAIKTMTLEEMAEFIIDICTNGVKFEKEDYVYNIEICQKCNLYNSDFDPDFEVCQLNRFCGNSLCQNRLRPIPAYKAWLEKEEDL